MNVTEGRYKNMKTSFRRKIGLFLPALILVSVLITLMPSVRAFAGVKLSKSKVTLYKNGGRKKIHLYLYEDGEKVSAKWKSSKKSVATVSSSGKVKARRKGTARITATYHGKKYTCTVMVQDGIVVDATKVSMKAGKKKDVKVTLELHVSIFQWKMIF